MIARADGVTLMELLVVLVLLGAIFGVSGVALASLHRPRESVVLRDVRAARALAIRSGRAVRLSYDTIPHDTTDTGTVLFLPDGEGIGPGVDPLSGAPRAVR